MNEFKFRLRRSLYHLAAATGLLQWRERRMRDGLTILMYHRVLPREQYTGYPLPSLVVPVEVFRRQMCWLATHCRVLPLGEALAELNAGEAFAKPSMAVTFDDGYNDNFTLAAPVLEEFGLHGTFFVTSGFVAEGRPQWYDRAAVAWQQTTDDKRQHLLTALQKAKGSRHYQSHGGQGISCWMDGLKRAAPAVRMELLARAESMIEQPPDLSGYQPMSPEQVGELHLRGHEIASHTVSHPILPQLADNSLAAELQDSAQQLAAWIGDRVIGFCYPNGDYDPRVERAVIKAGYRYACTVEEGINQPGVCPTRLTRLPITRQRTMRGQAHDPLGFRAELCRLRAICRR